MRKIEINDEFLRNFKKSIVLLCLVIVFAAITGMLFRAAPVKVIEYLVRYTSVTTSYSEDLFTDLLISNLISSILLAIISLGFTGRSFELFRRFYPIYLGSIAGMAISYAAAKTNILYATMLVMPHGIIEFAVMCLILNSRYLFLRKEDAVYEKLRAFTYVMAITILGLMVAAYIEVNITRDIASRFL